MSSLIAAAPIAATQWEVAAPKLITLVVGLVVFGGLITLAFFLGEKVATRFEGKVRFGIFLGPALLLLFIGLVAPTFRTLYLSFFNANGSKFIGLENYTWAFTQPEIRNVLRNTLIWVFIAPLGSTALGLAIAVLSDRMKRPAIVKSLIFMPMAISFVGAGIIWKFVYTYSPNQYAQEIGLLSQITKWLGFTPTNWLLTAPLNTILLIVVMIWIQTGFAMVVLSAAIKAIPEEVLEASLLDGASGWVRFRRVTVPMIRGTIVVVLSTITIATLKVFDIIRTMTGGNFKTSVIANEMYQQSFRALNYGTGSALAVILFLGVLPLVIYNVRTIRRERTTH
jgi:alpha-glucoside transport system permease protein